MRNVTRKQHQNSIFAPNKVHNAKSIGILDLRRHLNKNTKRVLSSKHRTHDNSFDMLMVNKNNMDVNMGSVDSHNIQMPQNPSGLALQ